MKHFLKIGYILPWSLFAFFMVELIYSIPHDPETRNSGIAFSVLGAILIFFRAAIARNQILNEERLFRGHFTFWKNLGEERIKILYSGIGKIFFIGGIIIFILP